MTVVAMWSNKDCIDCEMELFVLFRMVYSYSDYEVVGKRCGGV